MKSMAARRTYGTGALYEKHGAYYGRWRTSDGRQLNRRVGPMRTPSGADGLTRKEAERALRKLQDNEERKPSPKVASRVTVDDAADAVRRDLAIAGARKSYLENCESMQRVHIHPAFGERAVTKVTRRDLEDLGAAMLAKGLAPKTARNVLTFLHQVFEHALDEGWVTENPVRRAKRPGRRRTGDSAPDLQFLTVEELDAVIRAIPDETVLRAGAPTRRNRRGPAPPPPADTWGPVMRVIILTAALTGLRQSEILGLRWRDVDWTAQRIRVRNTWVRGEHSTDGKSDLSTRRSVPTADRLFRLLDQWSQRTAYGGSEDLVFGHPETNNPLDRSKVTKRFKGACEDAGVPVIRFHDLRHTFGTRLASRGVPIRTIQEFLGHADSKTTQIYMHYAPSAHEVEMVNDAFRDQPGNGDLSRSTPDSPTSA